jgi:5-methylcytosine-specific restriction endonuclease McrA
MNDIKQLISLFKSEHEHFLFVDFDFYKKWKYLIKFLIYLNKNYKSCEIYRRKHKFYKNIVVVGLKWGGKNVKRRTTGFAKEFLEEAKNPKCIYCNCKLNTTNATTDHIIPISKGGNNTQVNLMVCCIKCNSERGDMEFYKYIRNKNLKYKNIKRIFI